MNIGQVEQLVINVQAGLTPVYPPLVAPPEGAPFKQHLCYLLKGLAYLGDVSICATISDPTDQQACIAAAYAAYLSSLSDCEVA